MLTYNAAGERHSYRSVAISLAGHAVAALALFLIPRTAPDITAQFDRIRLQAPPIELPLHEPRLVAQTPPPRRPYIEPPTQQPEPAEPVVVIPPPEAPPPSSGESPTEPPSAPPIDIPAPPPPAEMPIREFESVPAAEPAPEPPAPLTTGTFAAVATAAEPARGELTMAMGDFAAISSRRETAPPAARRQTEPSAFVPAKYASPADNSAPRGEPPKSAGFGRPRAVAQRPDISRIRDAKGFGQVLAIVPSDDVAGPPASLAGIFGSVSAHAAKASQQEAEPAAMRQPLAILSKPKPVYTDEGRRLQIEGEVVLEAIFSAHGEVRVLRIVQGLGHGLDEAAKQAAEAIDFRPARFGGKPVDTTAVVHIRFQLAY